jgi:hypothetical protein
MVRIVCGVDNIVATNKISINIYGEKQFWIFVCMPRVPSPL